jgi:hypothetical protein
VICERPNVNLLTEACLLGFGFEGLDLVAKYVGMCLRRVHLRLQALLARKYQGSRRVQGFPGNFIHYSNELDHSPSQEYRR